MKISFRNLFKDIQKSLIQRKQIQIPSVKGFISFIFLSLLIYITIAIAFGYYIDDLDFHFRSEEGAITALSAIMLSITSGLSWVAFFLSSKKNNLAAYFWLLVTLGFGFFALDELLEFHERLGYIIRISPVGPSETFRNWSDPIVIVYGVIAVFVAIYFLSEILRYPLFAEILSAAFFSYCVHTIVDSTLGDSSLGRILEESAKVFSSTLFALAMFVGLLGIVSLNYQKIR